MSSNELTFQERVELEQIRGSLSDDELRTNVRQSVAEQAGEDIGPGDIVVSETESGELRGQVSRDVIRQQAAAESEEFGASDIVLEESGDGLSARISDEARREQVREQVIEQAGGNVGPEDVVVEETDDGLSGRLSGETLRSRAAADLESYDPDDLAVEQTEEGVDIDVRESARREQARTEALGQLPSDFSRSDIEVEQTDEGLSASVSQSAIDRERSEARETAVDNVLEGFETPDELVRREVEVIETESGFSARPDQDAQVRLLRTEINEIADDSVLERIDFGLEDRDGDGIYEVELEGDRDELVQQRFREQAAEQAGVSESDIEITETEDGLQSTFTDEFKTEQRQTAVEEAASEFDRFDAKELKIVGEGDNATIQPTEQALREEQESIREDAVEDAASEFDDFDSSDLEVAEQGDETVVRPTEAALRRENSGVLEPAAAAFTGAAEFAGELSNVGFGARPLNAIPEDAAETAIETIDSPLSGSDNDVEGTLEYGVEPDIPQQEAAVDESQIAAQIETEIQGNTISDGVSGAEVELARDVGTGSGGAAGDLDLSAGDIDVESGGVSLSQSGQQTVEEFRQEQAADEFESSIEETGAEVDLDAGDITQNNEGFVLTDEARTEARRKGFEANRGEIADSLESEINGEQAGPPERVYAGMTRDPSNTLSVDLDSEDVQLDNGEVGLSESGEETVAREQRNQLRENASDQLSEELGTEVPETAIRVEITDDGPEASLDREVFRETQERPLGNIQSTERGRAVVGTLDDLSRGVDNNIVEPGADVVSTAATPVQAERAVTVATTDAGLGALIDPSEEQEGQIEQTVETAVTGTDQIPGAGIVVDVPGAARGLVNAGDFIGAGAAESVQGRGGRLVEPDREEFVEGLEEGNFAGDGVPGLAVAEGGFAGEAEEGGRQLASEFTESTSRSFANNPVGTTAALGGALAGTALVTRGASAVGGPSAGRGVAFAFQPGEELLTAGATATLGRTSQGQRILSRFPGGRIDNEEIAIQEGRRLGGAVRERLRPGTRSAEETNLGLAERVPNIEVTRFERGDASPVDINVNQELTPDVSRPDVSRPELSVPDAADLNPLRNVERPSAPSTPSAPSNPLEDINVRDSVRTQSQIAVGQAERPFVRASEEISRLPARAELARSRASARVDDIRTGLGDVTTRGSVVEASEDSGLLDFDISRPSAPSAPSNPFRSETNIRESALAQSEQAGRLAEESARGLVNRARLFGRRAPRRARDAGRGVSDLFTGGAVVEAESDRDLTDVPRDQWSELSQDQRRRLSEQLIDEMNEPSGFAGLSDRLPSAPDVSPRRSVSEGLSSVRNTQLRIDIGRPSRQTQFVDEAAGAGQQPIDLPGPGLETEIESDYTPGEGSFETESSDGSNVITIETEAEQPSGVAVQRVVETGRETGTETGSETGRSRFESSELGFAEQVGEAESVSDGLGAASGGALENTGLVERAGEPSIVVEGGDSELVETPERELSPELGRVEIGSPEEITRQRERQLIDRGIEREQEFEREAGFEMELEREQEFERELERELETEQEFELELETETETEFESERESEPTGLEGPDDEPDPGVPEQSAALGETADGSDSTATGFLSETIATIATGGSLAAGRAPDRETLEETSTRQQRVGELPTAALVSGDEETREDISETQDLLFGGPAPEAEGERRGEEDEGTLLGFDGDDGGLI